GDSDHSMGCWLMPRRWSTNIEEPPTENAHAAVRPRNADRFAHLSFALLCLLGREIKRRERRQSRQRRVITECARWMRRLSVESCVRPDTIAAALALCERHRNHRRIRC